MARDDEKTGYGPRGGRSPANPNPPGKPSSSVGRSRGPRGGLSPANPNPPKGSRAGPSSMASSRASAAPSSAPAAAARPSPGSVSKGPSSRPVINSPGRTAATKKKQVAKERADRQKKWLARAGADR